MELLMAIATVCWAFIPLLLVFMNFLTNKRINLLREQFENLLKLVTLIDLQVDIHENLLHSEE